MVKRYREVDVPLTMGERKKLVESLDGRDVIIRDRGYGYTLLGKLHVPGGRSNFYFLVNDQLGGERLPLQYGNLEGLSVFTSIGGNTRADPTNHRYRKRRTKQLSP